MTIQEMKDKKKEKGLYICTDCQFIRCTIRYCAEDFFRGDGESKIRYASGFGAFF